MTNVNYYKVITEHFVASSHYFPDISISNCMTLKKYVTVTIYKIRSEAIRWQNNLVVIVMFAIPL